MRVVVIERIKFDDFFGVLSFLGDDILTQNKPNFSLKTSEFVVYKHAFIVSKKYKKILRIASVPFEIIDD